jgi:hypothetical protein
MCRRIFQNIFTLNTLGLKAEFNINYSFFPFQSLRKDGKGNLPNAAHAFTDEDIDLFFKKELLGNSNPDSLLRTMHRNLMMFFGLRANQEHRDLCWGDVVLGVDDGLEFIEYRTERSTKTRTGANPRNTRQVTILQ